jgi:VIT1/CCC1 family predicted Fe2+/Mn2+ transporter
MDFSSFLLGFLDGSCVSPSVAAGMVASSGVSNHMIVLALLTETIAATVSMSLSNAVAADTLKDEKHNPIKIGASTGMGYLAASAIPILSFSIIKNTKYALVLSTGGTIASLVAVGYIRSIYLHENSVQNSILKVAGTGIATMSITYLLMKNIH